MPNKMPWGKTFLIYVGLGCPLGLLSMLLVIFAFMFYDMGIPSGLQELSGMFLMMFILSYVIGFIPSLLTMLVVNFKKNIPGQAKFIIQISLAGWLFSALLFYAIQLFTYNYTTKNLTLSLTGLFASAVCSLIWYKQNLKLQNIAPQLCEETHENI